MAVDALPDVKLPAESSPTGSTEAATGVTETPPPSTPEPNLDLATYTPDEVRTWKKTGAVPELPAPVPEPKADPTPAKEPAGAAKADKPATDSAPVSQQDKKGKSNADTRKSELNREIQDLLKRRDALKSEVAPAKTDAAPPAPSPAAKLPKLEKPVKPVKPVWGEKPEEDWEQFEVRQAAYEGERDEYQEKFIQYSLAADRQEREKERVEAETVAQNQAVARDWNSRVTALKAKAGFEDYDSVIAPLLAEKNAPIPSGSVADAFILDSAVGPELLHYFGQHLDEAEAVGHMTPLKAARILTMLEQDILHPATPEKDAPPETKAEVTPPKKPAVTPITRAARPATDLKATNAAPVNELEAAVAADANGSEFQRFKKIRDLEDIERRKRG